MKELPKDVLRGLLEQVAKTKESEPDCEEVHQVIDVFAEAAARGDDVSEMLPLVKLHLELCQCCEEEYQALLKILQSQPPQET